MNSGRTETMNSGRTVSDRRSSGNAVQATTEAVLRQLGQFIARRPVERVMGRLFFVHIHTRSGPMRTIKFFTIVAMPSPKTKFTFEVYESGVIDKEPFASIPTYITRKSFADPHAMKQHIHLEILRNMQHMKTAVDSWIQPSSSWVPMHPNFRGFLSF
jgi:hypothetical protein